MSKRYLSIFILVVFFISCSNNTENKTAPKSVEQNSDTAGIILKLCTNCSIANVEIDSATAQKMINHHDTTYRKDQYYKSTIPQKFWIDACYISTLLSYISKNPQLNIDGISFYWGSDKNKSDKVQLFMTPTSKTQTSKRKALWPNNIIPAVGGCIPQYPNYENNKSGIADPMISHFNKKHRRDPLIGKPKKDSLSVGVWMETCVLECISNTIKSNPSLRLNGISVYNAAYSEKAGNIPGQHYANQSSVVIVFSKLNDSGETVDDFRIGQELLKYNKIPWKALNHGTLCPDSCY